MSNYDCFWCEVSIEEVDDIDEDVSGRLAYCSNECFNEDCRTHSERFNQAYSLRLPYTIGNAISEEQLLTYLKQKNPYIAHSFDEGDLDQYPGGWHWFWIPDLEELRQLADDDGLELGEVEHYEWEELMAFSHPVKGIALIQAFEFLHGLSVSVYVTPNGVEIDTKPSEPSYQIQVQDTITNEMSISEIFDSQTMNSIKEYINNKNAHLDIFRNHFGTTHFDYTFSIVLLGCTESSNVSASKQNDLNVSAKTAIENAMWLNYDLVFTIVEGNTSTILSSLQNSYESGEWFSDDMRDRIGAYVKQNFVSTAFFEIFQNLFVEYRVGKTKIIVKEQVFEY